MVSRKTAIEVYRSNVWINESKIKASQLHFYTTNRTRSHILEIMALISAGLPKYSDDVTRTSAPLRAYTLRRFPGTILPRLPPP
jgi:hypothetical protein